MIDVCDISKRYGSLQARDSVTFSAPSGAVTGFVGPNGAGKSTLLRIIAGLLLPDAGSVTIDGQHLKHHPLPGRLLGGFLSGESIPARFTARSYLGYVCDLQAVPVSTVDDALASVGLGHVATKRVKEFSLGMRQRLGIAAAIVGRPANLILDEPINGLDPDAILWLREYLRAFAADGGTVLLSSHHMSELALVADHLVMINQGEVVRAGPVAAFVATGEQLTYFECDDLGAALNVLARHGLTASAHATGAIVVGAAPQDVGRILFGAGSGVSHLRLLDRSIEQTYFDEIAKSEGTVT